MLATSTTEEEWHASHRQQIEEVRAPSAKYPEDAYRAELARILKARKAEGRVEEKFPGVRAAHVPRPPDDEGLLELDPC
jgi:hypothetical protein